MMQAKINQKQKISNNDRYQQVVVNGRVISEGVDRSEIASLIFPDDYLDKIVLDIVCARGFFCQYAKNKNATKVVGIEFFHDRFSVAEKAALQSQPDIFCMTRV